MTSLSRFSIIISSLSERLSTVFGNFGPKNYIYRDYFIYHSRGFGDYVTLKLQLASESGVSRRWLLADDVSQ